jgi:hypothetical protein
MTWRNASWSTVPRCRPVSASIMITRRPLTGSPGSLWACWPCLGASRGPRVGRDVLERHLGVGVEVTRRRFGRVFGRDEPAVYAALIMTCHLYPLLGAGLVGLVVGVGVPGGGELRVVGIDRRVVGGLRGQPGVDDELDRVVPARGEASLSALAVALVEAEVVPGLAAPVVGGAVVGFLPWPCARLSWPGTACR